jgi:hypothetical protein
VVGGSLVGLTTSVLLASHGVRHMLVESAAEREFVQNGALISVDTLSGKELACFYRRAAPAHCSRTRTSPAAIREHACLTCFCVEMVCPFQITICLKAASCCLPVPQEAIGRRPATPCHPQEFHCMYTGSQPAVIWRMPTAVSRRPSGSARPRAARGSASAA